MSNSGNRIRDFEKKKKKLRRKKKDILTFSAKTVPHNGSEDLSGRGGKRAGGRKSSDADG